MHMTIYTFGRHSHPDLPNSLRCALKDMYPALDFELEKDVASQGTHVNLTDASRASAITATLVAFAFGFVAGFEQTAAKLSASDVQRRTITRADTPAAKRKSDPPAGA